MDVDALIQRLRAPAYWMSGSSEGHEGDNDAPREAADALAALEAEIARLKHDTFMEARKIAVDHSNHGHVEGNRRAFKIADELGYRARQALKETPDAQ